MFIVNLLAQSDIFYQLIFFVNSVFIFIVLGAIVVCLFPLWPESVREYSWYLSVAGAIFVGGIIILAIRMILF